MSLARSVKQYLGVRAILPPDLQIAARDPTSADKAYVRGTLWLNRIGLTVFMFPGSGNWIPLGSGTTGPVLTINSLSPTAGNIVIAGTANQITATSSISTITLSVPAAFIAPGSIVATTSLATTNGNLTLGTAGNKVIIATGANASVGTSAAMTAGAVTVATTACSATAHIQYSRKTLGGTAGNVSITAQDGTGFTLTSSSGSETSTFNWWIINA